MSRPAPLIRIGELSRRLDVSSDRLRAWERRYGLLRPVRTAGGFRLYSRADELRVVAMQRHLAAGFSAAEAARAILAADASSASHPAAGIDHLRAQLAQALTDFDALAAHALLDRSLAELGVDDAMHEVIFPLLRDLGDAWARAEIHVGQEHFASNLLQGRLLALLRDPTLGAGPIALLACPSAELHTLGLIGFAIALRNRGWRVTYLGADTPIATLRRTAAEISPTIVVLSAVTPPRFADIQDELHQLAAELPLALAGAGATPTLATRLNAQLLNTDPITAAETITTQHTTPNH